MEKISYSFPDGAFEATGIPKHKWRQLGEDGAVETFHVGRTHVVTHAALVRAVTDLEEGKVKLLKQRYPEQDSKAKDQIEPGAGREVEGSQEGSG